MTKDERIKELETISLRLYDMVHESDLIKLKIEANELYGKIVNNSVLDDVIKQSEHLTFECEWCEDTGVMITGMDCTCDKAPSKS